MRERLARYASALIVAAVSTYCGLARHALAESPGANPCSLNDVRAWQVSLDQPAEEATPGYILRVTEQFIQQCPSRPEISSAHRLAGLTAGWAGKPDQAARHFRQTRYLNDTEALFMAASADFHSGETDKARTWLDTALGAWIDRLERRMPGAVSIETIKGGRLISVSFPGTGDADSEQHLWLAWPDDEGWPSALSVRSSRQLNAFHRLVAGDGARTVSHVRLYHCRTRRLLARSSDVINTEILHGLARQTLSAYLAAPDKAAKGEFQVCHFAEDMLPDPAPAGRIATR
jgi:hypothetical protein